jgi:hypothetical protein
MANYGTVEPFPMALGLGLVRHLEDSVEVIDHTLTPFLGRGGMIHLLRVVGNPLKGEWVVWPLFSYVAYVALPSHVNCYIILIVSVISVICTVTLEGTEPKILTDRG